MKGAAALPLLAAIDLSKIPTREIDEQVLDEARRVVLGRGLTVSGPIVSGPMRIYHIENVHDGDRIDFGTGRIYMAMFESEPPRDLESPVAFGACLEIDCSAIRFTIADGACLKGKLIVAGEA